VPAIHHRLKGSRVYGENKKKEVKKMKIVNQWFIDTGWIVVGANGEERFIDSPYNDENYIGMEI